MMTGKKLFGAAMLTTLVSGVMGCGGGGGAAVTEASFCMQKAEAECQVAERCAADKAACLSERQTICTQFATAPRPAACACSRPGNVGACIDKTRSVYAKTSAITPTDMADMLDACNYVFQGDGKVLVDACDVKYDCSGKVVCDKGFCATSMTKAAMQPCAIRARSAHRNYCTMNSAAPGRAPPRVTGGMPCSATRPAWRTCAALGTCGDASLPDELRQPTTTARDGALLRPVRGQRAIRGSSSRRLASCADFGGPAAPARAARWAAGTAGSGVATGGAGGGAAAGRRWPAAGGRGGGGRRQRPGGSGGSVRQPAPAVAAATVGSERASKAAGLRAAEAPAQSAQRNPRGSSRAVARAARVPRGRGRSLFAIVLCLPRLSRFGFWDPWELKLAEQARDIAVGATCSTDAAGIPGRPRAGDAAVGARDPIFGASELGARLPIALSAIGALAGGVLGGAQPAAPARRAAGDAGAGTMPLFVLEARQLTPTRR
jgi:hypothetical protein